MGLSNDELIKREIEENKAHPINVKSLGIGTGINNETHKVCILLFVLDHSDKVVSIPLDIKLARFLQNDLPRAIAFAEATNIVPIKDGVH